MSSTKQYIPPHLRHLYTVAPSRPAHVLSLLDEPVSEPTTSSPHLRLSSKASPPNVDTKTGSAKHTQDTVPPPSTEGTQYNISSQPKTIAASRAGMMTSNDVVPSTLIEGLAGPSIGGFAPNGPKQSESSAGFPGQPLGSGNKQDLAHLEPLIPRRRPKYPLDLDAEHTELELLPPRLKPLQPRPAVKVHSTPPKKQELTLAGKGRSAAEHGQKKNQIPVPIPPHLRGLESPTVPIKIAESSTSSATSAKMPPKSEISSQKAGASAKMAAVPEVQKIRTGDAALWAKNMENLPTSKMLKAHPCPYEDCNAGFDTVKLLRMHKEDRHDRCRKCDLDFKDFQEHLAHKIQSPEHITCPICGEDFRSSGGQESHMLSMHPNEQDISCPGCSRVFIRAGSLVDHLEKNECPGITIAHFDRYRTVYALREQFLATLSSDDEGGPNGQTATETTDGVAPEHGEEQHAAVWPSIAHEPTSSHQNMSHDCLESTSAGSNKTTLLGVAMSTSSFADSALLRPDTVNPREDKGKERAGGNEEKVKASAWAGTSSAAASLFPAPKRRRNTQEVLAEMLIGTPHETPMTQFSNGQPLDAANPDSRCYNPGAFRNILGNYKCPYPGCAKSFPLESNFEAHLRSPAHKGMDHRCPECLKIFKSATAITQHMEAAGSRCKIKYSNKFGRILGLTTGGIVTVEGQHVDGTVRYQAREPDW